MMTTESRFYVVDGVPQQREEGNDWQRWMVRMSNQIWRRTGGTPLTNMCVLEQYYTRSQREKRCYNCGEPCGKDRFYQSILIKVVKGYYHCPECRASYD